MTKLEHTLEIRAPAEKVYDYIINPELFASGFPGNVEAKKRYEGEPKAGDIFDISGRVGGRNMKMTLKFSDLVLGERVVLEGVGGDFKSFRDTTILEKTEIGTRVIETWEYEPPYSILGKIFDAIKIRKDMENYLVEGHNKMKETLER